VTHRSAPPLVAFALMAVMAAGCVAAGSPSPSGSGSPGRSTGFYLRAWITQALPPASSFALLARLVIADGRLIDTAVAIPAIYPGPLLIEPYARTISTHGISAVEDELRAQGLLVTRDFGSVDGTVGAQTAHLEIVVDGARYEVSGVPSQLPRCGASARCVPDPGTAGAFIVFWERLTGDLTGWLGADLGTQSRYDLERLSILLQHPIETFAPVPGGGGQESWPLAPFRSFGSVYADARCGTVSGADLATLVPILRRSNALTMFHDSTGYARSLLVRPLLPGEPDACASPEAADWTPTPAPSFSAPETPIAPVPSPSAGTPESSGGETGSEAAGGSASGSGSGGGTAPVEVATQP
jgi:hypothetical protein